MGQINETCCGASKHERKQFHTDIQNRMIRDNISRMRTIEIHNQLLQPTNSHRSDSNASPDRD